VHVSESSEDLRQETAVMFVEDFSPSNSRPSSGATEGSASPSSAIVGTLLQFQPDEEHKFQLSVSRDRLKSSRRVDTTLFFLLALFMMTGWKRVYVAGHADEMPYMALSGVVYVCCTLLYLKRASPGGLLEIVQLKMRVPLHIFTYSLAMLLFSRHIALPNMGACSPFVPEFSALEALVVYLLWAASYPTMAAIPFRYAIPIQLFAYWGIEGASGKECSMGDICSQTDAMYHLYMQATAKFASSLPVSLSSYSHSIPLDCRSIMGFLKVCCFVILWFR
jgi:hypothetical protein